MWQVKTLERTMDLLLSVTCELLSTLNVVRKAITSEIVGLKSKMQNAALSFLKIKPKMSNWTKTVRINGHEITALLNTGRTKTFVHP